MRKIRKKTPPVDKNLAEDYASAVIEGESLPDPPRGKFSSEPILRKLYDMAGEGNTTAAKIYLDYLSKLEQGITDIATLEDAMTCIHTYAREKEQKFAAELKKQAEEEEWQKLLAEEAEENRRKQEMEIRMREQIRLQAGIT